MTFHEVNLNFSSRAKKGKNPPVVAVSACVNPLSCVRGKKEVQINDALFILTQRVIKSLLRHLIHHTSPKTVEVTSLKHHTYTKTNGSYPKLQLQTYQAPTTKTLKMKFFEHFPPLV